jgi:hypothetical protein
VTLTYALRIQAVQKSDEQARAQAALAQMRGAVFVGIKPESVKGLSLSWRARHLKLNGDQDLGEVTWDLLLPNKMFNKDTRVLSGNRGQFTFYRLLNGEQSWSDVSVSSGEIPVVSAYDKPTADDQVKRLQSIRREQALQLIRLALPPSPDFPLTFVYAGEAQASDGRAHVVEVKGPNGFSARLFIDKGSSRLLMLTFPDPGSRLMIFSGGARGVQAQENKDVTPGGAEMRLRFSDYRQVEGLMAPHLVTYESNGKIVAELELKSLKLNPVFASDHFDPPKKMK